MKRSPLFIMILLIELIVAIILFFNYQYFIERLQKIPATLEATAPTSNDAEVAATAANGPTANTQVVALAPPDPSRGTLDPAIAPAVLSLFAPLPVEVPSPTYQLTDALVSLGKALYYDPRLSVNQTQSCNTCHPLAQYAVDALPVSKGHNGEAVKRNAPTVYNAALYVAQFWDGRSPTVEEQAKAPILTDGEMGMLDPATVEAKLRSIPGYAPFFAAAYPDDPNPITFDHVAQAIGAFERRLMTPSRFDRFLAGDYDQLSAQEQRGFATFTSLGCPTCHVGVTVGGLLFKKLGEIEPYPTTDLGRYEVTKLDADRYVFKVPSLRNVAKTAPYLHDGSIQTLEEMVVLMARHQLGKQVSPEQVSDVVAFLQTLTGEIPTEVIAAPPLP
ncbi:MAG: cytochrome c peroxidase [Caldilineaceae bacterium]